MSEPDGRTLSNLRKRRGVARASVTRLSTRLKDLEGNPGESTTLDLAQRMTQKLDALDAEFRTHHHALIDLIDDEETLEKEQTTLDEHDDFAAELSVRIKRLISACTSSPDAPPRKIASRRLSHLQKNVSAINEAIPTLTGSSDDVCLLHQYQEQLSDYKREYTDVRGSLLTLDLEESDGLIVSQVSLEKEIFECSLKIKKLLYESSHPPDSLGTSSDGKGVKLPKLDVPTFDGNILNWRSFWEQFHVSVHNRSNLSDSEKLVYLRHSLKDGSAKNVIEGLSRSGEYYAEAIECLRSRYDRPRLIHQTHVRMILEAPALKDGSGKELRRLHDTVQQHIRALKAMDYEPSGPFITSVLELKLDVDTMSEWQRHSQDTVDVPHYQKLLDFIDLRAQASETSVSSHKGSLRSEHHVIKKNFLPSKSIVSCATSTTNPASHCVLCQVDKHPLYACKKFKSMSHDQMVSTLKTNSLCMNCLRPGHFVKQCKSLHHCRICQKPHHTLLHVEDKEKPPNSLQSDSNSKFTSNHTAKSISSHAAAGTTSNSLLMTCRILVVAPDNSPVEVRALLDSASSASFVSERLTQALCLPRTSQTARISGVAGLSHDSPLQSIANFTISPVRSSSKRFDITAIVVPRVTCDLPLHPISYCPAWNHLSDIPLADPDFGHPGRIDILLGVDIFVDVLLHGRRFGPPGSPVAFETEFGWVLAGHVDASTPTRHIASHHASLATGDDLLRKFWEIEENPKGDSKFSPEEQSVVQHFKDNHRRTETGRFIVPLPKKPHAKPIGESRCQAVRRFLTLERVLQSKNELDAFNAVMDEYFKMGHAETVPAVDLEKPQENVFYLPMHVVRKESSTTTKIRAVFDASAKSSTGISLNDTLLVGPTVHPLLIDVLLCFGCIELHSLLMSVECTVPLS